MSRKKVQPDHWAKESTHIGSHIISVLEHIIQSFPENDALITKVKEEGTKSGSGRSVIAAMDRRADELSEKVSLCDCKDDDPCYSCSVLSAQGYAWLGLVNLWSGDVGHASCLMDDAVHAYVVMTRKLLAARVG